MRFRDLPKTLLKGLVLAYAYALSPLTGGKCRFFPTCSAYAAQALERHGALKGSIMAAKRILKCHPLYKGPMIDEVPANIDWPRIIGYKRLHCCDSDNQNQER